MTGPLAFVSVVFEPEYPLLLLQARSMKLFLPDALIDEIIVIDNSAWSMPAHSKRRLFEEYGPLAGKVRVLRARDICRVPVTVGYRSQQILKLCVADKISSDRYVVLDAKQHFTAPVESGLFETAEGRARLSTNSYVSHPLRPRLEHVLRYLDVDPGPHIHQFGAAVPPWVLITSVVRSLIVDIERESGRSFPREFDANALTELFLYAGWILAKYGSLEELYELQAVSRPFIWPGTANGAGVERAIRAATVGRAPVFAVHRRALAWLDAESARLLADYWVSRSLFSTHDDAERFVAAYSRAYRRGALRAHMHDLPSRATRFPRYLQRKLHRVRGRQRVYS